jgi:FkbM family methyltransferase
MDALQAIALLMQPRKLGTKIFNKTRYFYQLHVAKKPFFVAHRRWVLDRGDENLRLAYDLTAQSVVMDIGGYKGDFANAILQKSQCSIYVFEPVADFHRMCQNRFAMNPGVRCLSYGLSNADTEMFISREDDASSTARHIGGHRKEKIVLKDVAGAMEALGIGEVDLLKINIEGGEYDVLPRLVETGRIKRVRHLQIQFHDFIPNAEEMRNAIRRQLAQTHKMQWDYPFVWESWERL